MKAKTVRKITREMVTNWADQVERGLAVTMDLNDGSFEALMTELERRRFVWAERTAAAKELKPFLFRVKRGAHGAAK